jgi:CRP/FNR family transcriptional regulator, nitrogen oxide reductase regulator
MPPNPLYISHLRRSTLFSGLDDAALGEIAEEARLRRVHDGGYFFHQGEPATVLYVLTEGRVKASQVTPEGHGVLLRVIGPGETFGAVAALGDAVHPATAQADGECAALGWTGDVISALMERHPRLALNALRFLAGRLQEFQDRFRELATQRVERRIAHALLRLMRQMGRPTDAGILLDLPLSRQEIAEMSGTTLFTVSRTLSAWENRGLVESGRERVLISKPEALEAIAEELPEG